SRPDSAWTDEQLFPDNDLYFESMLSGIHQARRCITLATYIFELDLLGKRVVTALQEASERGVQVRVLFDGVGSMDDGDRIARKLESAGVEVRVFHPLPWQPKSWERA